MPSQSGAPPNEGSSHPSNPRSPFGTTLQAGWYRVATLEDQAQLLGSRGGADCSSTFDLIQKTSPTDLGECTIAAWASDNPGYKANATPAKRPKKPQVMVGPAC